MAASHHEPCSQDALSVCLGGENSNRLVSLWDIVNRFDCGRLHLLLRQLYLAAGLLKGDEDFKSLGEMVEQRARLAGVPIPEDVRGKLEEMRVLESDLSTLAREFIPAMETFCESVGFREAMVHICFAKDHMKLDLGAIEIRSELMHLERVLLMELIDRGFLLVQKDRVDYLDRNDLFGETVRDAFPSAARDIQEAGNCLAAECGTGAVFHLMRAAEFALRSAARDRDVNFKEKPLEEKEWGQILGSLEGRISELRNSNRSCWRTPELRDTQIRFYSEVVQELRGFNDAWRRHVSHADALAFYERDEALGIFKHVRGFFQKIAERISETSAAEQYWTSL